MKRILLGIAIIIMVLGLTACGGVEPRSIMEYAWGMDTQGRVSIFYMGREGGRAEQEYRALAREALDFFVEMDLLFDRFNEQSDIWRINHAGGEYVEVSHHTIAVLQQALHFREMTGGRFDVTIGAVSDLWDFSFQAEPHIPAQADIDAALETVGADIIISGNRVRLGHPGTRIDLGGIAKGYAADYIADFLRGHNVAAIVNLWGDIVLVGERPDGYPWGVGVGHPFGPILDNTRFVLEVREGSVVTSGLGARSFRHNGRLYHHIMDVSTGFPVDTDLYSVTVISPNATLGEGLTTALYVLGPYYGMRLVEDMEDIYIVLQLEDDSVLTSPGVGPSGGEGVVIPFFWYD
ncbi:MAG: FAD:protein FMN transferase [Clostridiales bacterium]|jgi:thiamine biosynthesis lipoprotein|nr:FAD:protein FMN transferase [Clostridiales bacterium]